MYSANFLAFLFLIFVIGYKSYVAILPESVVLFVAMFAAHLAYSAGSEALSALARTAREFVVLITVLAALKAGPLSSKTLVRVRLVIVYWAVIAVGYAALQYVSLKLYGTAPFLPWEFYGATGGDGSGATTLPSYWQQFASDKNLAVAPTEGADVKIRPVAFYSEPSYLGFMLTAAFYVFTKLTDDDTQKLKFFILCIAGCVLAETASGVFSLSILFMSYGGAKVFRKKRNLLYAVLCGCGVLYVVLRFSGRLIGAVDGGDTSSYSRLVTPLYNLYEVIFGGYIFGVPSYFLPEVLGFDADFTDTATFGGDNGLINILCYYGLGGVLIILLILKKAREAFLLFLLVGMFNGSLLGFDKGFILGAVLLLTRSYKYRKAASL
ncbi:MAG: hypothetical protein ACLGID_21180 [Gammaproteobacteria bacterium]